MKSAQDIDNEIGQVRENFHPLIDDRKAVNRRLSFLKECRAITCQPWNEEQIREFISNKHKLIEKVYSKNGIKFLPEVSISALETNFSKEDKAIIKLNREIINKLN